MQTAQKYPESVVKTIIRTVITTTIIAVILVFARVIPGHAISKSALFGVVWVMIFCIVFGGHWLEVLFINHLKFILPVNMPLLYLVRIVYWFLCAIPLFILAGLAGNALGSYNPSIGRWYTFGILYIAIELLMHLIMQLRWKKSFYNGVY